MIHHLETLVRQHVYHIACGYEDQSDADTLRTDPFLKLVCGQLPDGGPYLAEDCNYPLPGAHRGRNWSMDQIRELIHPI